MENNKFEEVAQRHTVKTENPGWCELDRVFRNSIGDQQCFYCNFNLECGAQSCIWREESA